MRVEHQRGGGRLEQLAKLITSAALMVLALLPPYASAQQVPESDQAAALRVVLDSVLKTALRGGSGVIILDVHGLTDVPAPIQARMHSVAREKSARITPGRAADYAATTCEPNRTPPRCRLLNADAVVTFDRLAIVADTLAEVSVGLRGNLPFIKEAPAGPRLYGLAGIIFLAKRSGTWVVKAMHLASY